MFQYPRGEIVWVSIYGKDDGLRYIITSKSARDFYFAYEAKDGKFVKVGKSEDPSELERKCIKL